MSRRPPVKVILRDLYTYLPKGDDKMKNLIRDILEASGGSTILRSLRTVAT